MTIPSNFEIEKYARERWQHEDELINQRTTWLLTTQGVLGTAYGIILYKIAEVKFESAGLCVTSFIDTLSTFSAFLTALGCGTALVSAVGISTACSAQSALREEHGDYLEYGHRRGKAKRTARIGRVVALSTPILCLAAWLVARFCLHPK